MSGYLQINKGQLQFTNNFAFISDEVRVSLARIDGLFAYGGTTLARWFAVVYCRQNDCFWLLAKWIQNTMISLVEKLGLVSSYWAFQKVRVDPSQRSRVLQRKHRFQWRRVEGQLWMGLERQQALCVC